MTLATRCSFCKTNFRIDQAALNAAEGWVRCGRCREVFNAIEGLFEAKAASDAPTSYAAAHDDRADAVLRVPSGLEDSSSTGFEPTTPATLGIEPSATRTHRSSPEAEDIAADRAADVEADVAAVPAEDTDARRDAPWRADAIVDHEVPTEGSDAADASDGSEPAGLAHPPDPAEAAEVTREANASTDAAPDPTRSPSTTASAERGAQAPDRVEDDERDLEAARISLFGPDSTPREQPEWFDTQVGADGLERMSLWSDGASQPARRGIRRSRPRVAAHRADGDFELSATTVDVVGVTLPSAEAVDELLASNARDTSFADYEPTSGFEIPSRPSRRRRPSLRVALRVAAIVLGVGLVVQMVLHARDSIAAHWPSTEVALERLCAPFGCELDAPRDIDALQVQSVTFHEAAVPGLHEIAVVLVNRSDLRVRTPALDLRISDAHGDTVARRVLAPAETGQAVPSMIAPGGEATLRSLLRIDHPAVAGYEVSVFYP